MEVYSMKNIKKVSMIFLTIILFFIFNVKSFAAVDTVQTNQISNDVSIIKTEIISVNGPEKIKANTSTQVNSSKALTYGELTISDILNILLIATGVVIILLAIAILIKLK